jgi:phosphoglucosamine mutase
VMVDHKGTILDGDDLLYIIIKHRKIHQTLKGGVVGTVMTNLGLEQALQRLNLEFVRVPVGDRHIISELTRRGWHLGGEPSGHIICLKTATSGDGIVTALQVLAAMQLEDLSLAELASDFKKYPQCLLNIKVSASHLLELPRIQQAVKEVEQALGAKGRVLLRRSGTEPYIRVMVEGENEGYVNQLAHQLSAIIQEESEK